MVDFARLQRQKNDTLAEISDLSAERLAFRPTPDAWSAVDVIDHLRKVESGILATVDRRLSRPHAIGIRDRFGFIMLETIFRTSWRVKVPASASAIFPEPENDLPSVIQRWDDTRDGLRQLLSRVNADQIRGGVFRHPVSGWMTLSQVLTFFFVHTLHHGHQLRRLRAGSQHLAIASK